MDKLRTGLMQRLMVPTVPGMDPGGTAFAHAPYSPANRCALAR